MADDRTQRTLRVDKFAGLSLNTPAELLENEDFQLDSNGDRRRDASWRNRRGFGRLNDATGTGVRNAAANPTPKRMVLFERDDNETFLVFAGGPTTFNVGLNDDVQQVKPGEVE